MSSQEVEKVTLSSQTDRRLMPAGQPSERYLMLTIQAPDPPRKVERSPLNLSLIIDRSGSMSGDKLEYVKEAAIHALRLLTDQDRTSVVIYDDEVELLVPSQAITTQVRNDMISRIRQVRSGGMTNLSGGWFTGCDQIADYMTAAYLNRALLLTDGLANVGMTDHEELVLEAKELRRRGITTTTIGVGRDFNQFLLQGIADGGGGHFYFIDKPNQIPNYFEGELGELLSTVAREMTLDLTLPAGVTVELLNETPSEAVPDGLRVFLGDAYAGESRILIFKLSLPARPLGQALALNLKLSYEAAQQRQAITITAPALEFEPAELSASENQPVNEAVLKEAGRLEAERAKMEALRREFAGDIAGAKRALSRSKGILESDMPHGIAAAYAAELDDMDQALDRGLTEQARKARHYATYRSQRSRRDYEK